MGRTVRNEHHQPRKDQGDDMSEMMGAEVRIKFPIAWMTDDRSELREDEFDADGETQIIAGIAAINAILAEMEWRDYDVHEAEGWAEIEASGELNYGISAIAHELESLRLLGVPYMAIDQAKYEIPGETTTFLPSLGGLFTASTNGDGYAADQGTIYKIADESSDLADFRERMARWFYALTYEAFAAEPLGEIPNDLPSSEENNR